MSNRLTGPRRYAELNVATPSTTENLIYHNNSNAAPMASNANAANSNPVIIANVAGTNATPFGHASNYNHLKSNRYPDSPGRKFISPAKKQQDHNSSFSTQATASPPNQLAIARKNSSKTRVIDIDAIPRPYIGAETSAAPVHYATNQYNNAPPASYTNYITVDDGNAGPRFVRSSFYKVPTEESILNNLHMPLGLIVQPLADPVYGEEVAPLVDYGETGPLRCSRCRSYVNPNWIFIQAGNTAICNICKFQNPVPKELYCPLDANGVRTDRLERPELSKGVYEFLAPSVYNTRKIVTSNLIFCVEASTNCYMTGIFHQIMSSIQSLLDYIPAPELTNICIVTYDTGINFFRVPEDLEKEISVIHVPEIEASCLPLPKKALFLNLQDERDKINYLVERIIKFYESNNRLQKGVTATCFGTALTDCADLLAQDGGRVLMFATQAPTAGVGKIKRRDDFKLLGTDKERALYVPQVEEYAEMAKNWLANRVAIDLFCFSPEYFDLATIGQVCNITGGNLFYYPQYNGYYDGEKVHYDMSRNLIRTVGYDAAFTIRCCQGVSFLDYVLPMGRKPAPAIEFATIDADTTINIYLKHEEKLKEETISFQMALLYTNVYGQRIIRVINFKVGTSNDVATIFRNCDTETVAQLILKKSILNITNSSVPKIRKELVDNLAAIFLSYRKQCATGTAPSQMVFPEALKVLPVFFLAVFKAHILRLNGDTKPDDRSFDLHRFTKLPLNVLSNMWYPKVYALHTIYEDNEYGPGNVYEGRVILSNNIAATDEKMESNGIYLVDNNDAIYIYVKKAAAPFLIQELFGVDMFADIQTLTSFPEQVDTAYFSKVYNIIDQLRRNKNSSYQSVRMVSEKDAFEPTLLNMLVEDERLGDSYHNFLCNVHKLIQEKL